MIGPGQFAVAPATMNAESSTHCTLTPHRRQAINSDFEVVNGVFLCMRRSSPGLSEVRRAAPSLLNGAVVLRGARYCPRG